MIKAPNANKNGNVKENNWRNGISLNKKLAILFPTKKVATTKHNPSTN